MAITHIMVVSDLQRSGRWYEEVLGASLTGEYGGTSAVFNFQGGWLLRARGAAFLTPPHESAAEIRCFFRDPDGHLFEVSERK